jgi:hypothetical protein
MNAENDSCGKVIYLGDVRGPEKVNDTCVETVHVGTMDRGFTLLWHIACTQE